MTPNFRSPSRLLPPVTGLVALSLFLIGGSHFLHLGSVLDPHLMFGDDGDGFFNLWVLLHNSDSLGRGFAAWADGRIFWPENSRTLFWSDILLAPTLPFATLRGLGLNEFVAYRLTALLMAAALYTALITLLVFFVRWSGPETQTTGSSAPRMASILALAFVITFSTNQMTTFQHFQNLCWLLVIPILLGLAGFSLYRARKWLFLALAAQVLLMISAPYFAVMGMILFGVWLILHLGRAGLAETMRDLRRTWLLWLTAGLLCLIPAWLYHSVPHPVYSPALIRDAYASRLFHLWTPRQGLSHDLLVRAGLSLPAISHESPAWLGPGLLLLTGLGVVLFVIDLTRNVPGKQLLLLGGCMIAASQLERLLREPLVMGGWLLAWTTLLVPLFLVGKYCVKKGRQSPEDFLSALMLAAALVSLGLALGPSAHYNGMGLDPSLHGLLRLLVPGLGSMRAVGRMMLIAQCCLGIWLFLEIRRLFSRLRQNGRRAITALVILALVLQVLDCWPVTARLRRFPVERLQPTGQDLTVLTRLRGSGCVFPTRPWHRNTHPMLYLRQANNLVLVNGYSGRSSRLLDQIMELGLTGPEPTDQQLALLETTGCDYLLVWKRKISRDRRLILDKRYRPAGETGQMLIYRMTRADSSAGNARPTFPARALP